ncbi:MAG: hypothetical protein EAZ89_18160, partial [Bacteroidetes bacterium]
MGLVERQSIRNVVANYAGVLLGMVNKLFLFREWLTREEFGMTELLVTVMVLGSEFSQWGVTKVIFRFFPYYHGRGRRENDFYGFVWVYTFGGILLLALGLLLLGPYITAAFAPNSPLFSGAYLWAIPMAIAYTLYRVGSSLSQSLLASVVPTFAYNVGQRLGQTLLMLAYHFHWLSFPGFVLCFVLTHFLPGLIIGLDLWRKKRLKWSLSTQMFRSRAGRLMIQYGAFSSLGEMTLVLIGRVDMLMLGWLAGEGVVGVYAIAFYISSL